MEKHKKIIIVFILIFVHVLLIQYVYFCPERSIIFGRGKTIAIAKAEVKQLSEEAVKELKRLESTDEYLELLLESLIYRKK